MVSSRQRAYLRSLAHDMDPVFQIGKNGVTAEFLRELDDALEARELLKVRVLKNSMDEPDDAAEETAEALHAVLVQKIGRVFVLYRPSSDEPTIELPEGRP